MSGDAHFVLIVEDSEECAATLEIALATAPGLPVHIVPSAEEALDFIETHKLAALITDIELPGIDGLELVSRVRRKAEYAAIPVLVITGQSDPDLPERARAAGASAYFGKPYSPVSVRRILEALIHAE